MLHVVLFEDNVALGEEVRRSHMKDHLAFLAQHAGQVREAGPLRDASGEPAGGMWVVEAENAAAVEHLVNEDPFWPTGLRASFRILAWTRVFADGEQLI